MEDFLEHYGVKGMRWGVRKAPTRTKVRVTQVPGQPGKATGGTGQRMSDDARRALVNKQKAKKSTTDALSDKELAALVKRMQLEQQYNNLRPRPAGEKLVMWLFGRAQNTAKTSINEASSNASRKAVSAAMAKAAAKAAAGG